ncbi:DIP1984 family protein [Curtobacterium sp. VKM Ac-1393]|uniref:DIP1984 family protein n=1 Tax=Curtobacterium sp. VKM Ac-1393 TaxID=2783814 RepID=UPI00188CA919|nr:DIP1984 family protein [Curtobacterium sp. VKM Ac-1393]MBF4606500.1 DIP1984 family protein [Curtobacterium sp. VKM Ac-1393]
MQLAEALIERADLQKRIEQLRGRIAANARYQEGEEPDEDARELLAEAERSVDALEVLLARINATNAVTTVSTGQTVTALLARRDALRLRHSLVTGAADATAGIGGGYRQLRSELRTFAALPTAELRTRADALAKEIRELDAVVQRTNWEVTLVD